MATLLAVVSVLPVLAALSLLAVPSSDPGAVARKRSGAAVPAPGGGSCGD